MLLSLRPAVKSVRLTAMLLLFVTLMIALVVVLLGMLIMGRAGRNINIDRLQIFIALASGFMLAVLFLELLPENISRQCNEVTGYWCQSTKACN